MESFVGRDNLEKRAPGIVAGIPALVLAPMDGVTDAPMRAVMGESGAFRFAVSEFLRVSQNVIPLLQ